MSVLEVYRNRGCRDHHICRLPVFPLRTACPLGRSTQRPAKPHDWLSSRDIPGSYHPQLPFIIEQPVFAIGGLDGGDRRHRAIRREPSPRVLSGCAASRGGGAGLLAVTFNLPL